MKGGPKRRTSTCRIYCIKARFSFSARTSRQTSLESLEQIYRPPFFRTDPGPLAKSPRWSRGRRPRRKEKALNMPTRWKCQEQVNRGSEGRDMDQGWPGSQEAKSKAKTKAPMGTQRMKNFRKSRLTVFLPQEVKQSKKTARSCRKSDFRRRSGG